MAIKRQNRHLIQKKKKTEKTFFFFLTILYVIGSRLCHAFLCQFLITFFLLLERKKKTNITFSPFWASLLAQFFLLFFLYHVYNLETDWTKLGCPSFSSNDHQITLGERGFYFTHANN